MRNPGFIFPVLLSLAATGVAAGEKLYVPELSRQVQPGPDRYVTEEDGVTVLNFTAAAIGENTVAIPVDPALLAGRMVTLSGEVAQTDVSAGPHPWNGVRLALKLVDETGRLNMPQAGSVSGSAEWTVRRVSVKVPDKLKSAAIVLGLDWVAGTARFRNIAITEEALPDYAVCTVTGSADRTDVRYRPGEEMRFSFLLQENGRPAAGKLRITRYGDDGKTETFDMETKPGVPAVCRTSLARPGFVMVKAVLLDREGKVVNRSWANRFCPVEFGLGACVGPETLKQGGPEPADFDAFWRKAKAELAAVPMQVLEKKLVKETDISRVYDVKIAAPGKRPVSGYLTIPKDAKPGSLPLYLHFHGYGVQSAEVVESKDAIHFFINAHGIENGREPEYYRDLAKGELNGYGFKNDENRQPDTCYFKNMILRNLRGLEFARSLPEWNGKETYLQGGSHGAFQTMAAAALSDGITGCEIGIPWLCDLGGVEVGRLRGWRPDYAPGLGYYDTVNFASRVSCPVTITHAGLSDWICPPSGVWVLFNNLKGKASMTMYQGLDHAFYPGYNHDTASRYTYTK